MKITKENLFENINFYQKKDKTRHAWVYCNDGFSFSMLADQYHSEPYRTKYKEYCKANCRNYADEVEVDKSGIYAEDIQTFDITSVEIYYNIEYVLKTPLEKLLTGFHGNWYKNIEEVKGSNVVCDFVPIEVVCDLINAHGGLKQI
jgi:hypothetical protein